MLLYSIGFPFIGFPFKILDSVAHGPFILHPIGLARGY